MSRSLSPNSNLENLRREARRWLKAVAAGDAEASARFRAAFPDHTATPKLREVQHALAREHGFPSWAALKQEMEDRARTHAQRVELFLEKGVHRYGTDPRTHKWGSYERDGAARGALAARLLGRHPEIARENIHTAVLAHDIDAVRAFLAKDPALARQRHPFDGWTPLARLAYARLPIPAVANALPIADLLLDSGADVSLVTPDELNGFTVLTGVIGGGEGGQSAHPQAKAFARLLIARGADPRDGQALYNTSLGEDDTFWLDLLWSESEKRGDTPDRWHEAIPDVLGPPLEYLLGNAVPHHPKRVAWLLAHGADARANNFYSKQPVIREAARAGAEDIVALLEHYGATRPELFEPDRFLAAARTGNIPELRRLAQANPALLQTPHAMFAAINARRADIAEALLDLGMSPDIGDEKNFRALHLTTHSGAADIARLLIARGAEIDPFELRYGGSPLTHASYHEQPEMIAILAPLSSNFRGLCYAGAVDRVRELLVAEPDRANREDRPGEPALFCLPGDEEKALAIADLLLAFGADPAFCNPLGQTPAEAARRRGLDDAAALIEDAQT
ncbi:MAG TPA: ankyrin repeat domain-containing protein [Hyphomonadaceae bacterium]|nr:ankyrin repeat domain-containing protein [Hyphomonadaceae bacterium]